MGWFSEQIKQRKTLDDSSFSQSLSNLGDVINSKSQFFDINNTPGSYDALEQVISSLGFEYLKAPDDLTDVSERIEYSCRPYGIISREVELKDGWHNDAIGTYLAKRVDNDEFIALMPCMGGYKFFDKESGKNIRVNKRTAKLISPEALVFYKPLPARKLSPADLVRYIFRCKNLYDIASIVIFMLIATALGFVAPVITNFLYGTVIKETPSNATALIISTCLFSIFFQVGNLLFNEFKDIVTGKISLKAAAFLEAAVMSRILLLSPEFFRKYSSGELMERSKNVSELGSSLYGAFFGTGFTALFSLAYIGSMFAFARSLVIPALIVTLISLLFSFITTISTIKISKEKLDLTAKHAGLEFQLINGLQKIKLAGAEKRAFTKWSDNYAKKAAYQYNPPGIVKLNSLLIMCISVISTLVLYWFAVKSGVNVAEYTAFNVAYGMVDAAFASLSGIALTIAGIKPALEMASPILESIPEVDLDKQVVNSLAGSIELSHVSFKYQNLEKNVIDDLSLKIEPGDYIAIVGKTGCGKSTLIRLLLGFEKPNKGAVYYDSKSIDNLDLRSLRRHIGTVMQDSKLFQGSIFSNIVISAPWLDMDAAWEAAKLAGIDQEIRDLPMGMNTIISENGGGFSGGQKQRIMIARAVAPKPNVLIFDEATSALDNITQKYVSDTLDSLKCTRIVIAHRLSTIKNCDKIFYLEDGKIAESGTYEELIQRNGLFASLVKRQRIENDN